MQASSLSTSLLGEAMNNKRTSRLVLHIPQEDMVRLVEAARACRQSIHDFALLATVERTNRVLGGDK
jgi:hypothetical protein